MRTYSAKRILESALDLFCIWLMLFFTGDGFPNYLSSGLALSYTAHPFTMQILHVFQICLIVKMQYPY